ncbi:lipocalin family protein [bacterium]|nr:lipocalin family protein [bacterium]
MLCLPLVVLAQEQNVPATVDTVDLNRYAGLWYEIAKIPNRFQKQCAGNTTAMYTLREDGGIDVVNRCGKENGDMSEARGVARIADPVTCAKLRVSFVSFLGWRPFWGNYWIIGLDGDYRWAVVGDPSRKYGWILSRTPQLAEADRHEANRILTEQGYDPGRFVDTDQEKGQD